MFRSMTFGKDQKGDQAGGPKISQNSLWGKPVWPNLANYLLTEFGQTAFGQFFVFGGGPKGWGPEGVGGPKGD